MTENTEIRKIETIRVGKRGWQWVATDIWTREEAIAAAKEITENDDCVYGIRISRLERIGHYAIEFSGDRDFNYIGVNLGEN